MEVARIEHGAVPVNPTNPSSGPAFEPSAGVPRSDLCKTGRWWGLTPPDVILQGMMASGETL